MDALIVLGSAGFAAAFVVAWFTQPALRTWLEQPKHVFDANVRSYDRARLSRRGDE